MLVRFYASNGKDREEGLAAALREGARQFDDRVEIVPTDGFSGADPDVDVACAFGVKGHTKAIIDAYLSLGKRTIMLDKALIRAPFTPTGYYRACLDGTTPLRYMMRESRSAHRWEKLGIELKCRQKGGDAILFAGSSQKYCTMHGLGDATEYARKVFKAARKTCRPLIYRPKPSWTGYKPLKGTVLSRGEGLSDVLPRTHLVVTHGSSAVIDAVIAGVPGIALGECAASPVCARSMMDVDEAWFPSLGERQQWAANLAWCQWKADEFHSGEAWAFLRREIEILQ